MKDALIEDIMTKSVVTVNRNALVSEVVSIFKENNFRHLPIVNDANELCGIISTTDIEHIKAGASLFKNQTKELHDQLMFDTLRACNIMTTEVITLSPHDRAIVAYQEFKTHSFRAIPITAEGNIIGILTPIDFLDFIFNNINP